MTRRIKFRRGTDAQRLALKLSPGEPFYVLKTTECYIGNGSTKGGIFPGRTVFAPVDAETVIAVGDLLWFDTDDAKPASMQADQGSELANQTEIAAGFLGIALEASPAGSTTPIAVATSGIIEYPCVEASYTIGDLVGGKEQNDGKTLYNQKVAWVQTAQQAIGRVAESKASATTILMLFVSTVMHGGVFGSHPGA